MKTPSPNRAANYFPSYPTIALGPQSAGNAHRREALRRSNSLVRFVRVVTPDVTAGLKFRAGLGAGRFECTIFQLAGIGCAGDIDVHRPVSTNDEWMHRMVAAQRQSGNDGIGRSARHDGAGGQ